MHIQPTYSEMAIDSALPTNMQALTEEWTGQLLDLVISLAPAHLRPYIQVRPEEGDGKYIIHVIVDRSENKLPNYGSADARAQEYGSGIRARSAAQHMITIRPLQENGWLMFTAKDGRFVKTKMVQHPGIEAANSGQGYIKPAVDAIRKEGRAELQDAVRRAILSDIKRSFGTKS